MTPLLLPGAALARLAEIVDEMRRAQRDGHRAELRVAVNAPRTVGTVLRLTAAPAESAPEPLTQLSLLEPVAPTAAEPDPRSGARARRAPTPPVAAGPAAGAAPGRRRRRSATRR